jgi:hypothetical protein
MPGDLDLILTLKILPVTQPQLTRSPRKIMKHGTEDWGLRSLIKSNDILSRGFIVMSLRRHTDHACEGTSYRFGNK